MQKINRNLSIPDDWNEVQWKTYAAFVELYKSIKDLPDFKLQSQIIAHFAGCTVETVYDLPRVERERAALAINKLIRTPIVEVGDNAFTYNGRNFFYKNNSFAQWVYLEKIDKGNPIDPVPYKLAVFFVEQKPEPKNWFPKLFKAATGTLPNPDLEGFDEKVEIINSLPTPKVKNMIFFLNMIYQSSKNNTTEQYLSGLISLKLIQAKNGLSSQTKPRLWTSPVNYLRFGVSRLTMLLIEDRLRFSTFWHGNIKTHKGGKSE